MKPSRMDTFVAVTVVETKHVPCMWGGSSGGLGVHAEAEDGRKFRCNWESFPSDSMSPYWMWHMDGWEKDKGLDINDFVWYDITQGLMFPVDFEPLFLPQFSDIISRCRDHHNLHYKTVGCFQCYLESEYPHVKEERLRKEAEEFSTRPFQGWK
jgi:hypothetical protein